MPWVDDDGPAVDKPRWSPSQSVAGDERPEAPRITDQMVLMVLALIVTVAVVVIAIKVL